MIQRRKFLLDTDIGTNIDDALCLAWLLRDPACDLLGITTVTGESEKRAVLADAICRSFGRDIPVCPGATQPLCVKQGQTACAQFDAIAGQNNGVRIPRTRAVPFLRRIIREHPGEITLLTIGPLTNIAQLFSIDPGIPRLLGGLVSMCGYFAAGPERASGSETNVRLDPHAAAVVFLNSPPLHRCVGLDVTRGLTMSAQAFRRQLAPVMPPPVSSLADRWFASRDTVTFHDPLAAIISLYPDVCAYERGRVAVELDGAGIGGTIWHHDGLGTVEVANNVDRERFFALYSSAFT